MVTCDCLCNGGLSMRESLLATHSFSCSDSLYIEASSSISKRRKRAINLFCSSNALISVDSEQYGAIAVDCFTMSFECVSEGPFNE